MPFIRRSQRRHTSSKMAACCCKVCRAAGRLSCFVERGHEELFLVPFGLRHDQNGRGVQRSPTSHGDKKYVFVHKRANLLQIKVHIGANMGIRTWLAGSVAAALLMCAEAPAAGMVTFYKDVLPILERNCQTCHRPGNIAPMSFLTYETTRPWASHESGGHYAEDAALVRRSPV